jgi:hypothetical protein
MRFFLLPVAVLLSAVAYTQADINSFSDEFSDSASLRQWSFFHQAEGFPDKIKTVDINKAKNGLLVLQPKASGWYADNQAPFMYKTVSGNFDVRAKLKVSGETDVLPSVDWSLAGLMIRQPKRTRQSDWMPRQENWLFITTGVADDTGLPVFEMKTTNNSMSNLKLRPAKTGWVELRIVRIDAAFILLSRYEGEGWQVQERFYRPVMMGPLQVGLNAYSSWNAIPAPLKRDAKAFNETIADAPADLLLQVDYIRFSQPKFDVRSFLAARFNTKYEQTLFYTVGNLLTDYSISNEEILKLIGN